MASICLSNSGDSVVPQASRHFVQLRHRGHTDDGAGDLPLGIAKGQRQLRRRQAVFTGQRVVAPRCSQGIRAAPALLAGGLVLGDARIGGGIRACQTRGVVFAGQQSKRQW